MRGWPTLAEALADPRFQAYLKQLNRRYSREKIEHMLDSLGIELGHERDAYFSDLEYAAALLDTRPENIADLVARDPATLTGGSSAGRSSAVVDANGVAVAAAQPPRARAVCSG